MKEHFLIYIFLSFVLIACNPVKAPGNDSSWDSSKYSVQRGDTLYSIAWRYELDFREVAKWNKISEPFLISPGQRLIMRKPVIEPENKEYLFGGISSNVLPESEKISVSMDYSKALKTPPPPIGKARPKTVTSQIVKPAPVYNHKKPGIPPVSQITKKTSYTKKISSNNVVKWSWPIRGKIISTFASNNHDRKGIDIKGKQDQEVRAASSGMVVYSGSGLISYGKLIIIKHNDLFLSAYAYNNKLLVKEGVRVKKGQSIAIVGKNANVTNLLHFEIRKDGKPVNPLLYLP